MDPVKIFVVVFLLLGQELSEGRWVLDDDEAGIKIRTKLMFPTNFVNVRINSHEERELRISYEKVVMMETYMRSGYSVDYDMHLRQVTDGRRMLQAAFQGGILKECDMTNDSNQTLDFLASFSIPITVQGSQSDYGDILFASTLTNYTQKNVSLAHKEFEYLFEIGELSDLVNFKELRKTCEEFLQLATKTAEQEAKSGNFSNVYDQVLESINPEDLKDIYNIDDKLIKHNVDGVKQEHNIARRSTEPIKRSRSKRAALDFNSVLIFPGTKWCGKGDMAKCYDDLGDDHELDVCCRDHDCCPYVIPPFSSRFNMFNYRFHSLLHCDCDQRFRGCLRTSQSTMANMIGKIYFNILGSRCFEFTEGDVCVERTWWGRCRQYEKQTVAVVKSQVSFIDENTTNENDSTST